MIDNRGSILQRRTIIGLDKFQEQVWPEAGKIFLRVLYGRQVILNGVFPTAIHTDQIEGGIFCEIRNIHIGTPLCIRIIPSFMMIVPAQTQLNILLGGPGLRYIVVEMFVDHPEFSRSHFLQPVCVTCCLVLKFFSKCITKGHEARVPVCKMVGPKPVVCIPEGKLVLRFPAIRRPLVLVVVAVYREGCSMKIMDSIEPVIMTAFIIKINPFPGGRPGGEVIRIAIVPGPGVHIVTGQKKRFRNQ